MIFVLGVLALLIVPTGIPWRLSGQSGGHLDAPRYAPTGPEPVGVRSLTIEDGAPLDLIVWYPARIEGGRAVKARYPYRVKAGDPLGTVSIASYAGRAIVDAPFDLSEGPYPAVILSPGFSLGSSNYGWLAEHLASYGFVVVGVEHPEAFDEDLNGLWRATVTRPQDVLRVHAYLDDLGRRVSSPFTLADPELVAVVGHSYGGYTALASAGARIDTHSFNALCQAAYASNDPNVFLCDEVLPHLEDMAELAGLDSEPEGLWPAWADPRLDAIVPLAGDALFFGQPGLAAIDVPVMAIGGTRDSDAPYMWGTYPAYEYVSSEVKARIALTDAEHMIFTGPCERMSLLLSFFTGEFCSDSTWDRDRAHGLINHFTTAFLLAVLKHDTTAAGALRADRVDFQGVEFVSEGF